MEGFTLTLALVDAIPVLAFGISMGIIASRFDSPVFLIGASLSILAGCCKVLWKLILGVEKKDIKWLNKSFVPMQAAGFLLMLASLILGFRQIPWAAVLMSVTSFPSVACYATWLGCMFTMFRYRRNGFRQDDADSNWNAQTINAVGQISLLMGILLA